MSIKKEDQGVPLLLYPYVKQSVSVYEKAISLLDNDSRLNTLIGDFSEGYAAGWKMCVTKVFFDSLDIKQIVNANGDKKVWTQGGAFSFSEGDTLYDTPRAYEEWNTALKYIKASYQVLSAKPSQPKKELDYYRKNKNFKGDISGDQKRGNVGRRNEIMNATPAEWTEFKELNDLILKQTKKGTSLTTLDKLCATCALEKKTEIICERIPGMVKFQISSPNAKKKKLEVVAEKTMTQDEFVLLLITGDTKIDE